LVGAFKPLAHFNIEHFEAKTAGILTIFARFREPKAVLTDFRMNARPGRRLD
jgi:hypothetical protein